MTRRVAIMRVVSHESVAPFLKDSMRSLKIITAACHKAIAGEAKGLDWQYAYAQMVDPDSVLELVTVADGQESLPSNDELQALAQKVRDLSGYLRYPSGSKPDAARDDLVEQAAQLRALAGL